MGWGSGLVAVSTHDISRGTVSVIGGGSGRAHSCAERPVTMRT